MTPQQNEAMKLALEALETCEWVDDGGNGHAEFDPGKVIAAAMEIKEALAEHAMQEVQRLGQEIEQKPVAWLLTDKNINSIQVDSIQRLIDRLKHAHHTDIRVRINGHDEWFEADWLKHMVRVTPPQRTEQGPKPLPQGWNVVEVVGDITKVWRMTEAQITSFSLAQPLPQRTEQCNYPDCKCPTENPCLKGLAQQEQEPVALVHIKDGCLVGSHRDNSQPFPDGQYGLWPVGITPPQRTEQCNYPDCKCPTEKPCLKGLAQQEQEPFAYWFKDQNREAPSPRSGWFVHCPCDGKLNGQPGIALYTTPPQRTWVGLTGLDQKELMAMSARDAVFATEAKLKEKNT